MHIYRGLELAEYDCLFDCIWPSKILVEKEFVMAKYLYKVCE